MLAEGPQRHKTEKFLLLSLRDTPYTYESCTHTYCEEPMPNHDATLTHQLIRLLEQYPDGLGFTACHEKLHPRQMSSAVRSALAGMLRHNIVVRRGSRRRYVYALRPDFRHAFAGREESTLCP
jgi:hypothetical protein